MLKAPVEYDTKCDVWSLGVCLYSCVFGTFPFVGDTLDEKFENVSSGKIPNFHKFWNEVSPECVDLIKKMLKVKPSERISAKEALEHPWFGK